MTPPGLSVLVVGPSWVGDMVMAQSLFKLLKQRSMDTRIDVLAPAWSEPLLARMPEVNAALVVPAGHGQLHLKQRYQLGRGLRDKGYDQAIVLPNSLKSALVPFWAGIPLRTGYVGELRYGLLNDARKLDKHRLPMTVQRFLALGLNRNEAVGIKIPQPSLTISQNGINAALEHLKLDHGDRPVLALCPGAEYGPAKRWPPEYFAQIAKSYAARGWQVWLFGSDRDRPITSQVCALTGTDCIDLAGRTTLGEAIDLLSLATTVVSNDSGLMHVAASLGRRLVAIYGSSDPGFTPPLSDSAQILYLDLACSPCFKRVCPLGHTNCLRQLTPETVLAGMDPRP
ncbi:MAG: lipopolysaccharide heptosyltransferase II [Acidiferrobacterales bacterium]